MYEDLWTHQAHVTDAHRNGRISFHLTSYQVGHEADPQYSAGIVKDPEDSGLRVVICEYPSVPDPDAEVQQERIDQIEVLEDLLYPSLRLENLDAEDDSEGAMSSESDSRRNLEDEDET
jgi:hypothetical protein